MKEIDEVNSKLALIGQQYKINKDHSITILDTNLGELVLNGPIDSLRMLTFRGCNRLTKLVLPPMERIFMECNRYSEMNVQEIIMSSKTKVIDAEGMSYCSAKKIVLSENLEIIGRFVASRNLETIDIPPSVKYIGHGAFNQCRSLKEVNLRCHLEKIEASMFKECRSLIDISIPDGVKEIGDYAFCNCSELKRITLPDSIERLGNFAFYNCSNLEEIVVSGSRPIEQGEGGI